MADTKKFLDQAGVGTLWAQVIARVNAIPEYDDIQVKADIAANTQAITDEVARAKAAEKVNADAIAILNSDAGVEGSVAYKITQMVLAEDTDGAVNKIEEIAAWIANHPTDAAEYNQRITANAEDIDALEKLVGSKDVATQIAEAIAAQDLSKYALAADLTALATRMTTAEGKITTLEGSVADHGTRLSAVETKAANNATSITNLTGRLDGIVAQGGEPNVINNIKVNGEVQAIVDKAVDITVPVVEALTADEIKAVCV